MKDFWERVKVTRFFWWHLAHNNKHSSNLLAAIYKTHCLSIRDLNTAYDNWKEENMPVPEPLTGPIE